jgi:hypothetical protein
MRYQRENELAALDSTHLMDIKLINNTFKTKIENEEASGLKSLNADIAKYLKELTQY